MNTPGLLTLDHNGNPDLVRHGGYTSLADWAADSDLFLRLDDDGEPEWFDENNHKVDVVAHYRTAQVAYAENYPEEVSEAAKRELRADPTAELIELFPSEWDEVADEIPACVRCEGETASLDELLENKPVAWTEEGWVCPGCSNDIEPFADESIRPDADAFLTPTNPDELERFLLARGFLNEQTDLVRTWLARGDAAVVYQNVDLSDRAIGEVQVVSYGSDAAQLTATQFPDGPPPILPDIGGRINWRFALQAVVRP